MGKRGTKESMYLQNFLAKERTDLANERTTLAHFRTGFSCFVLGIAILKLFEESAGYLYAGYASIAIGIFFILFGLMYYPIRHKRIKNY